MSRRTILANNGAMAAIVLALCFVFNMLGRGMGDSYIVFLLPLGNDFGWSRSEVSSVYSIYLIVVGLSAPVTGWMFDRFGPRVVYALGFASLGAGYFLAGGLTQLWQFQLCVGVLGGIGVSALGMVSASSLIRRWFRGNMSTAIAVAYAGFGLGEMLIVPLAQYLIGAQGWRETYRVLGGALMVFLPFVVVLPWRAFAAGNADYQTQERSLSAEKPASSLLRALRTPGYWLLVQVFVFTALGMYTVVVQMVAYFVDIGFAPLQAASAFGAAGMLSVLGMIATGWFCDRIGYRAAATASFVSTFLGIGLLLALSYRASGELLVAWVLVFGIAQGARGPIIASLAARLFPGPGFATIYGTIFACMSVGSGLGSWISGALHDLTGGYRASFLFSMACIVLAAAPFWTSRTLGRFNRGR